MTQWGVSSLPCCAGSFTGQSDGKRALDQEEVPHTLPFLISFKTSQTVTHSKQFKWTQAISIQA